MKKASFHLINIGKVRKLLTEDATKKVMQNLVISRIDYCNALLSGIQQDALAKLQRLQNQAARIVTRTKWHEHITPVLEHLHWLPVKFRIDFKILLMAFKALNGLALEYLSELVAIYKLTRTLRSGSQGLLVEPKTRLAKIGDRAFSNYAPCIWNQLPSHIKASPSVQTNLKSYENVNIINIFLHFRVLPQTIGLL